MKITIVTPDLSGNCAGRAYILAQVLSRKYEVEIAGLGRNDDIWFPIAGSEDVPMDLWNSNYKLDRFNILGNLKRLDCDIVYASKPVFNSFGLGLLKKWSSGRPLILDIDDWEMGGIKDSYSEASIIRKLLITGYYIPFFMESCSPYTSMLLERMIGSADHITVSNSFLQQRYGGDIVPHGKDFTRYLVDKGDVIGIKRSLGIPEDKFVIMFLGTPRAHKGLEVLIDALAMMKDREVMLAIVGMNDLDPYSERLRAYGHKVLGDRVMFSGMQPYERMPAIISAADVMAIPSMDTEYAKGQIPSKIFDAIASGKPFVATAMNDMESISRGYGSIVRPNDAKALADSLMEIKADYHNRSRKSLEGRAVLEKEFSYDSLFTKLDPIIQRLS